MKKILVLGVIAIIAGVLLVACGGDNGILPTRGCELTQALQGRWEGVGAGERVAGVTTAVVFDGDSVVEYSEISFESGRAVTQEDLDNNTPFYAHCGIGMTSSADGWVSNTPWDNSGAVQRELISAEYAYSTEGWVEGEWGMVRLYNVLVRERREGIFAVCGETVTVSGAEFNRIEFLWECDRGHEESAIAVTVNQLGADTLGGLLGDFVRVEG